MFNSKSKTSFDETSTNASTMIGVGTTITGDLETNGDIRIDGTLKGSLNGKARIIIGTEGIIEGHVTGTIKIQELLNLHGNAKVNGDIYAGKLQIEPTAIFNGKCHMGANIVELNNILVNVVNQ